jgi:glutamate-1-semialdehyde 2,1-aminomutase
MSIKITPPVSIKTPLGLRNGTEASRQWFARASAVLAGGISSSARSNTTGNLPYPLYITRGEGSHIWDADGNEFIDYLLSYGSVILGHQDADMVAAAGAQLNVGTMFGTCNTLEVELAEQISHMVPGADLVRFSNSGSEAICGAVRAARGYTGRTKILKFEGHYHGWVDVLAISNRPSEKEAGPLDHPSSQPHSRGIPQGIVGDVLIAPWNHRDIVRQILDEHESQLAAVILEPIVANNACTMPEPGFLEFLRQECTRRGILLIYDEIVTGFRLARGGAAEYFGITPDLMIWSKAVGGGMPISAFAGRRDIMNPIAANTVKHGGTYNGNPLCAAAALAVLRKINEPGVLESIHRHGDELMAAIRDAARHYRIPCVVQGVGGMFQVVFTSDGNPLRHYRDLLKADAHRYGVFRQALLERGVHINNSGSACWFVSAAHGADDAAGGADLNYTCSAIQEAMAACAEL